MPVIDERTARRKGGQPLGLQPLHPANGIFFTTGDSWLHLVKNTGGKLITAIQGEFVCPSDMPHPWGGFEQDSLRVFGQISAIPPGRTIAFAVNDAQAKCLGVTHTVIFSDGTFLGDEGGATQMDAQRRGIAEELPRIVRQLQSVALGQQTARELASKLLSESDSLPVGNPVDLVASGRRNILIQTANLLSRQELPRTPADFNPSRPPTVSEMMRTMHVNEERAHAAALMQKWVEWENALKFAGTQSDAAAIDQGRQAAALPAHETANKPVLTPRVHDIPTLAPIPSSAHCPIKVVAVREREFGAGPPYIVHIRYNKPVSTVENEFHGQPRDPNTKPSADAILPELEASRQIAAPKKMFVDTTVWTGDVGSLRWFEITGITYPSGRLWHTSKNSRCIFEPQNPTNGTDWQSALQNGKFTQYVNSAGGS